MVLKLFSPFCCILKILHELLALLLPGSRLLLLLVEASSNTSRGLFLKSVESSLLARHVRQQVREVQVLFASLKDSGSELLGVSATVLAERASDLLLMPVVVVAAGSFDRTVCMSSVALDIQDAGHCPACCDNLRTLFDEAVLVSWGL